MSNKQDQPRNIYSMAAWSARRVANRATAGYDQDTLADMTQEAAIAIWRVSGRGDESPTGYAFKSGINAAFSFVREFIYNDRANKGQGGYCHVALDINSHTSDDPEAMMIEEEHEDEREEMLAVFQEVLLRIFLASRKKGGERGRKAAERDAQIVILSLVGLNTTGIAHELGIPQDTARIYLRRARATLAEFLTRLPIQ